MHVLKDSKLYVYNPAGRHVSTGKSPVGMWINGTYFKEFSFPCQATVCMVF